MDTRIERASVCLIICLAACAGSTAHSPASHTLSRVGHPAVLPCTWQSHLKIRPESPYIQWEIFSDMVFERMGEEQCQGEAYRDRVDVPKQMLLEGNCSLFLRDVRFSDAGVYDSYLVVGDSRIKERIFIQSVQLSVVDHKEMYSVERGQDLILDLHTHQATTVVFQSTSAPEWSVLWQRGRHRHTRPDVEEKHRKLVIKNVKISDSGTYRVMDPDGLALSTVKVTVREPVYAKENKEANTEKFIAFDHGRVNTPLLLMTFSVPLSAHILLRLL